MRLPLSRGGFAEQAVVDSYLKRSIPKDKEEEQR
jgi:hypothetical protein